MEAMEAALRFIMDNWEAIARALGEIITVVALTKWGMANKDMLRRVTTGIELFAKKAGDKAVKLEISKVTAGAPAASTEALTDAIAKAEDAVLGVTNKKADKPGVVIAKALVRAIPLIAKLVAR